MQEKKKTISAVLAKDVMSPILMDGLGVQDTAYVVVASRGCGDGCGDQEIVGVLPADEGGLGRVVAALEAFEEELRKRGYDTSLDLDALTLKAMDGDFWEVEAWRAPFGLTPRCLTKAYDVKEEEYLLDDARKALEAAEEEGVLQVGMASGLAAKEGFLADLVFRFENRADANFPERDTWIGVVDAEVRIGTKRIPIEEAAAGAIAPGMNAYNVGYLDYDGDPDCTELIAGSLAELVEAWASFAADEDPMAGVLYVEYAGLAKDGE